jgi:hypothetical protein
VQQLRRLKDCGLPRHGIRNDFVQATFDRISAVAVQPSCAREVWRRSAYAKRSPDSYASAVTGLSLRFRLPSGKVCFSIRPSKPFQGLSLRFVMLAAKPLDVVQSELLPC